MTTPIERDHINHALVEDTRPPMYTAMKYWGKKPHNIWQEFIERYCPPNGFVLDPFAGSGIAGFEAVKIGRRAAVFDLNPYSNFMVRVLTSKFNESFFRAEFDRIVSKVKSDPVYLGNFTKEINGKVATIYNYRWDLNKVVDLAVEFPSNATTAKGRAKKGERNFRKADELDKSLATAMSSLKIPFWYPTDEFPSTPSVTHKFILDIGGNSFENLWTRRNLYILALLFSEIRAVSDPNVQLQLLSGFVQTLHLCSKMVVPRSGASNRDFSGSWGRADYMVRRRQMEQNPLVVFERSCIEKQGVISAMTDASNSLPSNLRVSDIKTTKSIKPRNNLTYGTVDVVDLYEYVDERSVDFVITDPPYAGLVPYLDISLVWLVWLKKIDKSYTPDLKSEITIKRGQISREEYRRRLQKAFKEIHRVLKDDGYLVVTFHHKKMQEWNDFVNAVRLAGFKFDKVTHQYNRRSGESNVAMPYGTSGADFYVRCTKFRDVDFTDDASGLRHFIVQKAIEIIGQRNEPTPYDFIIAGLMPEMLQAGYTQSKEHKDEIQKVLGDNSGAGKIFKSWKNSDTKAGDFWWFNKPEEYISFPDRPLTNRLGETVLSILRRKVSVKLDDVIGELFRTYPNGLTPDPRGIKRVLEQFAYQSNGKWKIQDNILRESTEHTEVIRKIVSIGKRGKFKTYVGKREQPEFTENGDRLRDLADMTDLTELLPRYATGQIIRVEMIDAVWVSSKKIAGVFEVENSTDFTSAIVRGSNIEKVVPKYMIVPDSRVQELKRLKDPLFLESFRDNNWKFLTYTEVERLFRHAKPSISDLDLAANRI